jgi:hypothetical protein
VEEHGVYPNPFSDRAHLYFTLRSPAQARVDVYNIAGEPIASLSQACAAGKNDLLWDGSNGNGGRCASGVYVLRVHADGMDGTTGSYWSSVVIQR